MMAVLRNIPWPRVLAEGSIIVVSILLALWVDAWWSDRQDAIEEQKILAQLRAETVQLLENIARDRTRAKAIQVSTTTLANLALQGPKPEDATAVDRLLRDFMWHVGAGFTDAPVLESLFVTGDLEFITNGDLRREIAQTRVRLHRLRAEIQRESKFYNETVMRFLQQNADLAQFYTHGSVEPGLPATPENTYVYPGLKRSPFTLQIEVLELREFRNILMHRLTLLINALWWWEENGLDEGLNRILALIDRD